MPTSGPFLRLAGKRRNAYDPLLQEEAEQARATATESADATGVVLERKQDVAAKQAELEFMRLKTSRTSAEERILGCINRGYELAPQIYRDYEQSATPGEFEKEKQVAEYRSLVSAWLGEAYLRVLLELKHEGQRNLCFLARNE